MCDSLYHLDALKFVKFWELWTYTTCVKVNKKADKNMEIFL